MIGDADDMLERQRGLLPNPWFIPSGTPVYDTDGTLVFDTDGTQVFDGRTGPPILGALLNGSTAVNAFIYALLLYIQAQARISTSTDGWLDLKAYDFFGLRFVRSPGQSDASFAAAIIAEVFRQRNTRQAIIKVLTDLTGHAPVVFEPWRIPDSGAFDKSLYYGAYGLWGSRGLPYTVFITAYRGNGATDAQIYAALESVRTAGITYWVSIANF